MQPESEYPTRCRYCSWGPLRGVDMPHKDPAVRKAYERARYLRNPKLQIVNTRNWRARHPEKKRLYKANRRARKHNAVIERISLSTLYMRDSKTCSICHKHVYLKDASIDHIIPLSRGGSHTYKNCVLTHYLCNVKKGYRRIPPQQLRLF